MSKDTWTLIRPVVGECGTPLGYYIINLVSNHEAVMEQLVKDIVWERRDTCRSEHYSTDNDIPAYTYGKGAGIRTYHPSPYHPAVRSIKVALEAAIQQTMDVCFLNYYVDGSDHLGWHADDSPSMDPARSIVTVSLGEEREIWFRPMNNREQVTKIKLQRGSAFVMRPGLQQTHYHRIPKAGFSPCGPRISLTFRGYIHVDSN